MVKNEHSLDGQPVSDELVLSTDLQEGVVLLASAGLYTIQLQSPSGEQGSVVKCSLRGNLKKSLTYSTSSSQPRRVTRAKRPRTTDSVAVGDRVRIVTSDDKVGMIEEVLPRRSKFSRLGFRGQEQTIVSNLDQLVIVFACAEPNPDYWMIDKWLIAAEIYGLKVLLIANKCDLVDEVALNAILGEYSHSGYQMIATSVRNGTGVEELRGLLKNTISAFTGPSGVGKSSLLNSLQPGLQLAVGAIGQTTWKGKHTTTARSLIPLESGGWVADTPGLRQLELPPMTREEIISCFPDFLNVLQVSCRFQNCRHDMEPDCQLKLAVKNKLVNERRYKNYLEIARSMEDPRH